MGVTAKINKTLKLLIADDHNMIKSGLKAIISSIDNVQVIGECNNGQEVIDFLKNQLVDIILMDVKMPVMNGIDATTIISKRHPEVKTLVLSVHNEKLFVKSAFDAGASGYLLKNSDADELENAIQRVSKGKQYYGKGINR